MATARRKFDRQYKLDAVRMAQESDRPLAEIARDLGIHPNVLYRWRNEMVSDAEHAFPGNGNAKPEDAELRQLRRELELVKEERDIFKKSPGTSATTCRPGAARLTFLSYALVTITV